MTNDYQAGLERGKAYARREMADQTTNFEEIRKHLELAANYERRAEELAKAA